MGEGEQDLNVFYFQCGYSISPSVPGEPHPPTAVEAPPSDGLRAYVFYPIQSHCEN